MLLRWAACGLLLVLLCPAEAWQGSYEAPLPVQLSTDPDLCAYVPCRNVLPGADSFSVRKGRPSYVEGYRDMHDHEHAGNGKDDGAHEEHEEQEKPDADTQHARTEDDDTHRELVGYAFLSTDIVDIPGYSGKPVVTLIGFEFSALFGGLIVTETVFSVPGLGQYVVTALLDRDYPAAQGIVLILAGIVVLGNLSVDLLYGWLDPRTRVQVTEK